MSETISAREFRRRIYAHKSEDVIQADIVTYLRDVLPASHKVIHVPNGGSRNKIEAAKLKRMGVLAGVPDIEIIRPAARAAWIEVKAKGGTLSKAQREFRDWCREWGHPWCLARSIEDVRDFLEAEHIPTRETAQ